MNRHALLSLLFAFALLNPVVTVGQQATEVYIPIGKSPGVSGVSSVIGTVRKVDYAAHTLVVRSTQKIVTVEMDTQTDYYLDRSDRRLSNSTGDMYDCKVGRTIEVKLADDGTADWVKIDADSDPAN